MKSEIRQITKGLRELFIDSNEFRITTFTKDYIANELKKEWSKIYKVITKMRKKMITFFNDNGVKTTTNRLENEQIFERRLDFLKNESNLIFIYYDITESVYGVVDSLALWNDYRNDRIIIKGKIMRNELKINANTGTLLPSGLDSRAFYHKANRTFKYMEYKENNK